MQKDKFNTVVCPCCGTENYKEAAWCSKCGAKLTTNEMFPLSSGTVLQKGKYTVLKEVGKNRSDILYYGSLSDSGSEVLIREFYPASIAERELFSSELSPVGPVAAAAYETAKEQFRQEGKTLQTLVGIPNIASVRDVFEENGTVYIVEDRINGETLQSYLSRTKKMSFNQAMQIVSPVMNALIKAHEHRLIHGNINLSNIVIRNGTPVLVNFGISNIEIQLIPSKKTENGDSSDNSEKNVSKSVPDTYEAALLKRTVFDDINGVAAVLYTMVTGKSLGTIGNGDQEKAARSILEKESGLDVDKASAIMMGLNGEQSGHFKSMAAFLKALQNSPQKRLPIKWVIIPICIFLIISVISVLLSRQNIKNTSSQDASDSLAKEETPSEGEYNNNSIIDISDYLNYQDIIQLTNKYNMQETTTLLSFYAQNAYSSNGFYLEYNSDIQYYTVLNQGDENIQFYGTAIGDSINDLISELHNNKWVDSDQYEDRKIFITRKEETYYYTSIECPNGKIKKWYLTNLLDGDYSEEMTELQFVDARYSSETLKNQFLNDVSGKWHNQTIDTGANGYEYDAVVSEDEIIFTYNSDGHSFTNKIVGVVETDTGYLIYLKSDQGRSMYVVEGKSPSKYMHSYGDWHQEAYYGTSSLGRYPENSDDDNEIEKQTDTLSNINTDQNLPFYGIWCGATKNESGAEDIASKLIKNGFPADIFITTEWSNLNPEKWYVVSAGRYDTRDEAEKKLSQVRSYFESAYIKYSGEYLK